MSEKKSTLDLIRNALEKFEDKDRIFYGTASKLPKGSPWDYTVFSRDTASPSDNLTSISDGFIVFVVREAYVPEGTEKLVLDALKDVPGLRLESDRDIEYRYDVKPGTKDTVEGMMMHFRKARKP